MCRAASVELPTRMIAAGTSVISSQKKRNDNASRAHRTPTRARRNAALSTPVTRPAVGARHIRRGVDERRASDERERDEEHAASARRSQPAASDSLVKDEPQVSSSQRAHSPATPKASAASGLEPESASEPRTRGAEQSRRPRARPEAADDENGHSDASSSSSPCCSRSVRAICARPTSSKANTCGSEAR